VILFAENCDDEAFLFQRALSKSQCGRRMIRVKDGSEVFDYFENKGSFADRLRFPKPTILVSDLNMPTNGGLVVLSWLKLHGFLEGITFVMFTSSEKAGDIERAMYGGAHAYVLKSMSCDEMVEWLREMVAAVEGDRFDEHGWLKCPHNAYLEAAHFRLG